MNKSIVPPSIAAQAEAFVAARRGWSGGLSMAVTAPADVPDWIPEVVSSSFYDRMDDPELVLTGLAARYNDLQGKPGEKVIVPTDVATTPAANLAVDVPATDDSISSDAYELLVKEGVKSIAWYDRTQIQSGQDVNQLAGRKVGSAMEARVELDLGAALVAGRNTAADDTAAVFDTSLIKAMKRKIPARLRKRGLVVVGSDDLIGMIDEDPALNNAAIFGSDELMRTGQLSRPLYGVRPFSVDDNVLPEVNIAAATGPVVVMFAVGMLAYGFQKNPTTEQERDARARLTRHVGTMLHAEGTLEAAGIVATRITG